MKNQSRVVIDDTVSLRIWGCFRRSHHSFYPGSVVLVPPKKKQKCPSCHLARFHRGTRSSGGYLKLSTPSRSNGAWIPASSSSSPLWRLTSWSHSWSPSLFGSDTWWRPGSSQQASLLDYVGGEMYKGLWLTTLTRWPVAMDMVWKSTIRIKWSLFVVRGYGLQISNRVAGSCGAETNRQARDPFLLLTTKWQHYVYICMYMNLTAATTLRNALESVLKDEPRIVISEVPAFIGSGLDWIL